MRLLNIHPFKPGDVVRWKATGRLYIIHDVYFSEMFNEFRCDVSYQYVVYTGYPTSLFERVNR